MGWGFRQPIFQAWIPNNLCMFMHFVRMNLCQRGEERGGNTRSLLSIAHTSHLAENRSWISRRGKFCCRTKVRLQHLVLVVEGFCFTNFSMAPFYLSSRPPNLNSDDVLFFGTTRYAFGSLLGILLCILEFSAHPISLSSPFQFC